MNTHENNTDLFDLKPVEETYAWPVVESKKIFLKKAPKAGMIDGKDYFIKPDGSIWSCDFSMEVIDDYLCNIYGLERSICGFEVTWEEAAQRQKRDYEDGIHNKVECDEIIDETKAIRSTLLRPGNMAKVINGDFVVKTNTHQLVSLEKAVALDNPRQVVRVSQLRIIVGE
ncbi:MAG: hypothetical protein GY861_28585 [bacterium]|nr:hypothetical protein [bacterium]